MSSCNQLATQLVSHFAAQLQIGVTPRISMVHLRLLSLVTPGVCLIHGVYTSHGDRCGDVGIGMGGIRPPTIVQTGAHGSHQQEVTDTPPLGEGSEVGGGAEVRDTYAGSQGAGTASGSQADQIRELLEHAVRGGGGGAFSPLVAMVMR